MPLLIQTLQNINNDAPEVNNDNENPPPPQNHNNIIINPGNVAAPPPPNNNNAPRILPENTQQKSNLNQANDSKTKMNNNILDQIDIQQSDLNDVP